MTTLTDLLASQREQSNYLDALAAAIRSIEGRLGAADRALLESRLEAGGIARLGLESGPSGPSLGSGASAANYLGNVEPVAGQSNLLFDPLFESVPPNSTFGATPRTSADDYGRWEWFYRNSSGSLGSNQISMRSRGAEGNAFNSGVVRWLITPAAGAADAEFVFESYPTYQPVNLAILPYLVAGLRLFVRVAPGSNVTTLTGRLELVDGSDAVRATSAVVDLKEIGANAPIQLIAAIQLTAAEFIAATWRVRFVLQRVVTGVGVFEIGIAEPQLHFAYTPDPIAFSPRVGAWSDDTIRKPAWVRSITYDGSGKVTTVVRQGDAGYRIVSISYNGDGSVNVVSIHSGDRTAALVLSYGAGKVVSIDYSVFDNPW